MGLVAGEFGAEQLVDAHHGLVEETVLAQGELRAVAGEPDRVAGGELVKRGLLEHVQRHVDEFHIASLGHVRAEADAVALVERAVLERGVGQRHEIVDVHRHVLLVELKWGDADLANLRALVLAGFRLVGLVLIALAGLGVGFALALAGFAALAGFGLAVCVGLGLALASFALLILIIILGAREEVELLRRFAERHGADAVHGAHVLVLQRTQLVLRRPGSRTAAQLGRELAQLGVEVLLEIVGIAGVLGLRIGALGH